MMTHNDLNFEQLLDWLDGRLSPENAAEVEALVATADAETQAQINWLRAFESVSNSVRLAEPPQELRTKLEADFAQYAQQKAGRAQNPGIFQRIVAALRFDSALQPAVSGLRGAENAQTRQIIFSTTQADVALHIRQRKLDRRVDLFGQVLPNGEASEPSEFCVQLLRTSAAADAVEDGIVMADEVGEFTFEAIAPGNYELILSDDLSEIVLSDIVIPALELKTDG